MSWKDDDRWERFLQHLNYLSMISYSGSFALHMNNGRIASSTMKQVNDAALAEIRARKERGE
jgi:hypothetical protein